MEEDNSVKTIYQQEINELLKKENNKIGKRYQIVGALFCLASNFQVSQAIRS